VQRGIELAEALTDSEGLEQRDLLYLVAVGRWRQRKHIEARRTLRGLMQVGRGGVAGCGVVWRDEAARGEGRIMLQQRADLPGSGTRAPQLHRCRLPLPALAWPAPYCPAPQVYPEFRQAEALLEACDREIIKDGLVGVGAGLSILGAVAAIAVAAMRK
jgi:hypothetical protein